MHPARLLGCRCPSGGRLFLFLTRRARRAADALRDGPGVPSRDARPPAPRPAFRRAWLWKTSCSMFLSAGSPPSANLRLRCDAHLQGRAHHHHQPRPQHAHAHAHRCGAAHAVVRRLSVQCRAPGSPSSPAPTSCTQTLHSLRRAVWHTHTQWVAPHARGEAGFHDRNGTRGGTRFLPRDTPTPCPHNLAADPWPTMRRT